MAMQILKKPMLNSNEVIAINPNITELSFDFDYSTAIFEKIEEDLVISFEENGENSNIVLEDFYLIYSDEFVPNFLLDDILVSGEDFFNALDSTLMPAAGDTADANFANSVGIYETDNPNLAEGVTVLDGVDGGSGYSVTPFLSDGVSMPVSNELAANTPSTPPLTPPVSSVTPPPNNALLTLTATENIDEGNTITYTVNIDKAPTSNLTVEVKDSLGNVYEVTIEAGSTSGSLDVPAPLDDVYVDAGKVSATLGDVTEGGDQFDDLVVDTAPATSDVTDTIDSTTLTLEANASDVAEGGTIEYTLTLSNPTKTPLEVTVTVNGEEHTVTIPSNSTTVSFEYEVRDADAFVQGDETIKAEITGTDNNVGEADNFEKLEIGGPVNTTVSDDNAPDEDGIDPDTVILSLESGADVSEGESLEYTVKLTDVNGNDVTAKESVTVEVNIGGTVQNVTIPAGSSSFSFDYTPQGDDVYVDPSEVTASLGDVLDGEAQFEDLNVDSTPVTNDVTDTIDSTTLTLEANASDVTEGDTITFTLELGAEAKEDLLVTLNVNGTEKKVTIKAGENSVTFEAEAVYDEDGTFDVKIVDTDNNSNEADNFESLTWSDEGVSVTVDEINVAPAITEATDLTTYDDALDETPNMDGSNKTDSGSFTVTDANNDSLSVYIKMEGDEGNGTLIEVGTVITGSNGKLTISSIENGEVRYTYEQTSAGDHPANDVLTDNFIITATDGSLFATESITVNIKDDGPIILSDEDNDGRTEGNTAEGVVTAEIEVDFGGDSFGQILFPGSTVGTSIDGIRYDADSNTWVKLYSYSSNPLEHTQEGTTHTIKFGDVTLTYTEGDDTWTVSYPNSEDDDREVALEFVDSDGDSVEHTVFAGSEEITDLEEWDIVSKGDVNDTVLYRDGHTHLNVQVSSNHLGAQATVDYETVNGGGLTVDVDDGNDTVYLGQSGDDTVYLGESHYTTLDTNPTQEAAAQEALESFMYNDDGTIRADSSVVEDASREDSGMSADVSQMSRPYVDIGYTGIGDDTVYGEGGTDLIHGGSGNDTIDGGSGNDGLRGGSGDDNIYGGDGDDIIHGGDGSDIIRGGKGSDVLIGGEGKDIFTWEVDDYDPGANDTIIDFELGTDVLDLTAFNSSSYDISLNVTDNDVEITIEKVDGEDAGTSQTITLLDTNLDQATVDELTQSYENGGEFRL